MPEQQRLISETMFLSSQMIALWAVLISTGVITRKQAIKTISDTIPQLEDLRGKGAVTNSDIDQVVEKTKALIRMVQTLPGVPIAPQMYATNQDIQAIQS